MPFDFMVVEGQRSLARQQRLFRQGRMESGRGWEVCDPARIVTACDGVGQPSKHMIVPAQAVKLAPSPLDWTDRDRFHVMAGVVLAAAAYLRVSLRWGSEIAGDEAMLRHPLIELAHFQLNRDTY